MPLSKTNLLVSMAPIPPTFVGTPQELAEAMVRRMQILSASGTNFIFIGDTEPSSNVGPWLKDGTKWYVYSDETKRYVPLDITDSEKTWFFVGASTPATSDPPVWLRTTKDQTQADPSVGSPVSWYVFDGTNWVSYAGVVAAGPTASRPVSPVAYQQFYDTSIAALIWYERNLWRTVSGVPGDIKQVAFTVLTDALTANPGWVVFGASNQSIRGRWLSQATKDSGGSPETVLTVSPGIAERAAFETFGETDGVKIDATSSVPYPPTIALWTLVKE